MNALATNIDWSKVNKVAIISRAFNGDLLLTDSLMLYIKSIAPLAKITLFANSQNAQLLPYLKNFDYYEVLPARGKQNSKLFKIALKHRKDKFDIVINDKISRPSKLLNVFMWLLGAKNRIGYVADDWTTKLVNCGVKFNREALAKHHRNVMLFRLIDRAINEIPASLFPQLKNTALLHDNKYSEINKFIARDSNPTILISLINNRELSSISVEKYVKTLNEAFKSIKFKVIISSKNEGAELSNKLAMPSLTVLTPDFNDFMYVLNRIDAVYVGDGGIMHMAAALNKTGLILFGETSMGHWRPLTNNKFILLAVEDATVDQNVNNINDNKIVEKLVEVLKSALIVAAK